MLRTFLESNVIWKAFFYYLSHKQYFISCWNQHVGSFWISHLSVISSPDWLWLSERWKKRQKNKQKNPKLHKIKNPMKQVEEKSPRMPCSRLTQQLNVTLLRVSPLTPNLHEAQWYCKGRKVACYCEKKTTCNIYLCYIILMCRRRSLHFWYQQRKTLSFCRSH